MKYSIILSFCVIFASMLPQSALCQFYGGPGIGPIRLGIFGPPHLPPPPPPPPPPLYYGGYRPIYFLLWFILIPHLVLCRHGGGHFGGGHFGGGHGYFGGGAHFGGGGRPFIGGGHPFIGGGRPFIGGGGAFLGVGIYRASYCNPFYYYRPYYCSYYY
ncbi:serine/threonine-protein phosphatase 1 regulatory subunit 10-like [Cephus cinctus]|uniref:Serine/threonine-protein phosphatase 1 regulatory subunit 10-like n=1 Tax=Cephus cinctus TaxID=211228 RepID=A0AAJ7BYS6_CEPCN|nr:serine/threonine-protein phosphatase 1 regulatory subunit 10-like [Cephus cinctus]